MATQDLPRVSTGSATLDQAATGRITAEAERASPTTGDGGAALKELGNALRRASISDTDRRHLLVV